MSKTNRELLVSFKKSNKQRRERIAQLNGYGSADEYRRYLESNLDGTSKTSTTTITGTDMVIAFDTTGSMSSYIKAVRQHVKDLIPKLFSQNPYLKISIVAFGDYCDMVSSTEFGKAYQVIDLTDDQNALINFVNNAQDTYGGDGDEFYELVIKKITEETSWRDSCNRNVLLIADAAPHEVGYSYSNKVQNAQIDWREEAVNASNASIIFDTLTCGYLYKAENFYKELSAITGGVQLPFSNSQKTADVLEATSLARGGKVTEAAFYAKSVSSDVVNDTEISAVYGMYKTVISK